MSDERDNRTQDNKPRVTLPETPAWWQEWRAEPYGKPAESEVVRLSREDGNAQRR
jgi:hypothetical protein